MGINEVMYLVILQPLIQHSIDIPLNMLDIFIDYQVVVRLKFNDQGSNSLCNQHHHFFIFVNRRIFVELWFDLQEKVIEFSV